MREIEIVNLNGNSINFMELIYYDGSKLQVSIEDNSILAWHDCKGTYEEWFLIKVDKILFDKYISNKSSLLETLKNGTVQLVKREFDNYNDLVVILESLNLEEFECPDKDSYLGFNFHEEFRKTESDMFISYQKNTITTNKNSGAIKTSTYKYEAINKPMNRTYKWRNNNAA